MPENGTLQVRVFTSSAQLPVEGATVAVTRPTTGGSTLLAVRVTDESGRISPISIAAPERSQSLSPGARRPWTPVDITAEHPDYERILVENVQIFAGITTVQELELIPLGEQPEVYNLTEVFEISGQPL